VRVLSLADVDLTQMMRRALRTFGPAAALLFAGLVAFALVVLGPRLAPMHGSGGCTGVPLVNGQPAYRCPTPPP
jgi:hypothetical protein